MTHSQSFCIGLNCALGAQEMRPYLVRLGDIAECFVHAYPNAGLPNSFGEYDEKPSAMKKDIPDFASNGMGNLFGGCCGSTPDHIRAIAIAEACEGQPPHIPQTKCPYLRLSGLEPLTFNDQIVFANIGERW